MLTFWAQKYAEHLEAEIAWLRTEKQKAEQARDVAVAELVRLKTDGQAQVHPAPLIPDRLPEAPPSLAALERDPEWAQVGT